MSCRLTLQRKFTIALARISTLTSKIKNIENSYVQLKMIETLFLMQTFLCSMMTWTLSSTVLKLYIQKNSLITERVFFEKFSINLNQCSVTKFMPMIPITIIDKNSMCQNPLGSLNKNIPAMTAPAAPIPVQIA